jgi:RNA polymerase sigma factor (sigma-70 family)
MGSNTIGLFLRHLALSEEVSRLAAATDSDLLAAYEAGRGQAAFSELMRRHGPMVLRTCCRVLGQQPEAEDAFQATFVMLARRARALQAESAAPLSLGGWLHRVAYRTALNISTGNSRRKKRERRSRVGTAREPDPVCKATWNEVRPILDAELDALPADARQILITCYLQGSTHADAAAELGIPLGSVAWHLDRARTLLARRLKHRGIDVTAAALVALLAGSEGFAGVPAVLLVHSVEAAVTFTEQSPGAVSESVAELVKGGLTNMKSGSVYTSLAVAGWASLLGAGLIIGVALKARANEAPDDASPAAKAAEPRGLGADGPVLADRFGDPLPRGALARLGTVRLRNVRNGQRSIAFTRDGRGIITAGWGNATHLWELSTGKPLRQFGDINRQGYSVALSRDGSVLASRGGSEGNLCLWQTATAKLLAEVEGERTAIVSLDFSPDGKFVASGGAASKLRLWDVAAGREVWEQGCAPDHVLAVGFTPDGKQLTVVDSKGLSCRDAATGERQEKRWEAGRELHAAVFLSDGRTVAVVCQSRVKEGEKESLVCLVDCAGFKQIRQFVPDKDGHGVWAVAADPAGKVLATAVAAGEIRLWDVDTGKELRRCQGDRAFLDTLAFSADGKLIAGLDDGFLRLWETGSGKEIFPLTTAGHVRRVSSVAFTPDGGTVLSGSWDGVVRVWDAATGAERRRIAPGGGAAEGRILLNAAGAVSPDGTVATEVDLAIKSQSILAGNTDFGILVRQWNGDGTREVGRRCHDIGAVYPLAVALSPDGGALACVVAKASGAELQLLETASGKLLWSIPGDWGPAFSADGKLVVTGRGKDKGPYSLAIREVATGKELCTAGLPDGQLHLAALSPDGRTLATLCEVPGNTAFALRLWPLFRDESGKAGGLRIGSCWNVPEEVSRRAEVVAFSPDGRTLALTDDEDAVRLIETATGRDRARFSGHFGEVRALAFSADGRRLASAGADTTILIWDATGGLSPARREAPCLSARDLDQLWADLASNDAGQAALAIRDLAADPAQTVPFFVGQLKPTEQPAPEAEARLIAALDDDAYAVRAKAQRELERFGVLAQPAMRRAREKTTSAEVRRRLDELLAAAESQYQRPSSEMLRGLRAVEVLERIGVREARRSLEALAAGAPAATLTQSARAALDRLRRAEKR